MYKKVFCIVVVPWLISWKHEASCAVIWSDGRRAPNAEPSNANAPWIKKFGLEYSNPNLITLKQKKADPDFENILKTLVLTEH